jgi:antitoxin VapB
MSGQSQAVRLPKAYRFDCDEVEISREGDAVVLRPRPTAKWASLDEALRQIDALLAEGDLMSRERDQPPMQERPELDEAIR